IYVAVVSAAEKIGCRSECGVVEDRPAQLVLRQWFIGLARKQAPRFQQDEPGRCLYELAAQLRVHIFGRFDVGQKLARDFENGEVVDRPFIPAYQGDEHVEGTVVTGKRDGEAAG